MNKMTSDFNELDEKVVSAFLSMAIDSISEFDKDKAKSCIIYKQDEKAIIQSISIDDKNIKTSLSWVDLSNMFVMSFSLRTLIDNLTSFDLIYNTSYSIDYKNRLDEDDFVYYDVDKFIIEKMIKYNKDEVYHFIFIFAYDFIKKTIASKEYLLKKIELEALK